MEFLAIINSIILSFIFAESIVIILFTKSWQFRFKKTHEPIDIWKKILMIMILFVFVFPFINWLFANHVSPLLENLGRYQISLLFISLPSAYLITDKRILSSEWKLRDIIPVALIILNIIITILT